MKHFSPPFTCLLSLVSCLLSFCRKMNIFVLSKSPKQSAAYHGDKHVIKMVLESCQMLYSAHWFYSPSGESLMYAPLSKSGQLGYKPAHINHPCTKWVRESKENYIWTARLAICLAEEYEYRWPGRVHSCKEHAVWLKANIPRGFPMVSLTPFAIAMDVEFKMKDAVASYRNYYIQSKSAKGLTVYTKRTAPRFLVNSV